MRAVRTSVLLLIAAVALAGCTDPFARPMTEPGPIIGQGRIERPVDGFAVTFPTGWQVREVLPAEGKGRWGRPPGDLGGRLSIFASPPSGIGGCYVHVNDRFVGQSLTVGAYVERSVRDLRADRGIEVEGVRRSHVALPAGPAVVLDIASVDGVSGREYVLAHDGSFYAFGCFVPDGSPAQDRWLRLAESLEL